MTLAQLQSFVLVARLGSVKAAAAELEVTEPAVSVAVAALRKELGDELFVRQGRGIALTPGGRRLAALASEILGLAEQARRSVHERRASRAACRSSPRALVAEHIGPLIDAFTARDEGSRSRSTSVPGAVVRASCSSTGAPTSRSGPHPGVERSTIASAPFLRCRLIVVAAPGHPLAGRAGSRRRALAGERWLVGQPELDPTTGDRALLRRARARRRPSVATYSSQAAAVAAAAAGEGVVLTLAHSVVDEVRRRALVRLDVRGTPVRRAVAREHAGAGAGAAGRAGAAALRDDAGRDAGDLGGAGGRRVRRGCGREVHVTLWQSVAEEIDAATRR